MTNILMVTHPQGGRGPANAYGNHYNALKNSSNYKIYEIEEFKDVEELSHIDIFWFSIRFHPNLYFVLRNRFPDKTFVMGPNVLFEKAEVGPSDEWEKWFVSNVHSDFYFNKADFYLERAKKFYKNSKNYDVLRNCIDLSSYDDTTYDKDFDVLLYYKNRRIDNQLDDLFPKFLEKIKKTDLKYHVIEYGNYQREEYFSLLKRSKLCMWFSIEDFCANAQLESQYYNVPIIGTTHNCTDNYDKSLIVDASDMSESEWISWKEDMPEKYFQRMMKFFDEDIKSVSSKPSDYIKQNFSYQAYERQLSRIFG